MMMSVYLDPDMQLGFWIGMGTAALIMILLLLLYRAVEIFNRSKSA